MKLKIAVIAAGLLAAAALASCSSKNNDNTASSNATTDAPEAEKAATLAIAEGKQEITVQVVSFRQEGGLQVARLSVINSGSTPVDYLYLLGDLASQNGTRYRAERGTTDDAPDDLDPGDKGEFVMRFRFPSGLSPQVLYVWEAMGGGEPAPLVLP